MSKNEPANAYPELQHILQQQELVSDIALGMNTLEDFSVRVNRALQRTGEHTGVSRVYIFEDAADGATTNNTYEWCNRGIAPQIEELQGFPYDSVPSWKRILIEEGLVYSEDINQLPADLYEALDPQDIRSIIVYPLYVQQQFFGFIGFDECVRNKAWSRLELELLRSISGIIASSYERRLMEEALRCERDRANAANRAKSQFLAHMSHEIRSPMNIVLGYSEVLMDELPGEEQRNMARSIITGGRMLLSLLNDILDLSKIEAGKMKVVPQPVLLRPVLDELGLLFGQQAEKKGIAFTLSVSDALPDLVVVDETRIRQVIFNLAGNAMKFTSQGVVELRVDYILDAAPAGRHVCNPDASDNTGAAPAGRHDCSPDASDNTGAAPAGRHVCNPQNTLQIKISDTGIGIPPHEQEHIFEPFVQSTGVADGGFGGTGLGLSICKRLVEQMGGTIGVASQVGEGSVFTVRIPCSERNITERGYT
ncbi:MAG: ATP-binding protein [Bacteroidales bacterium]